MANDIDIKDLENVSGGADSGENVCKMCGSTRSLSEIFLTLGFKDRIRDFATKREYQIGRIIVCQKCMDAGFKQYIALKYPGQIHSSTHYNILRRL